MSISVMVRHGLADQQPLCYIHAEPLTLLAQRLNPTEFDDPNERLKRINLLSKVLAIKNTLALLN